MGVPFLIFDISGRYAHFRMRYTTTSAATHLIPPRHTIGGIIGAILGVQKDEVYSVFSPEQSFIGLETISKLSTVKITFNLLKIKGSRQISTLLGVKEHIIVPFQLVREPKYRIYFHHEDNQIMSELESLLKNKECIYSPSLGLASMLAKTDYIGKASGTVLALEETVGEDIETLSVAPLTAFDPIPQPGNHFIIDKFARYLDKERKPDGFYRVVFDANAQPIKGQIIETQDPKKHMGSKLLKIKETDQQKVIFVW